ncbi:hypothetical protein GIB67_031031 [Kingdonia uniflora]|uniref:RUNKEL ARM-repeat domain-containing protein n=1 Tax=Kingdonia uniflora TaxID=39325 RepID=A0A7J7NGF9_9MAGN|nr:hypothetical protein GIB67_031031 [Kingdonia uniflora]
MKLNFDENTEDEAHEETDGPDNLTSTPTAKLYAENQDSGKIEESCSGHVDVASTPPSAGNQRRVQRVKTGSGSGPDSDSSRSVNDLSQLLWHPSDLALRPVMPSRKGNKVSGKTSLPTDALPPSEFVKISKEHLDKFNSRTIALMTGSTSLEEKQNMIKYLEILSGNTDVANILTNGPVMPALVRVFRLSKVSTLRVQITSVIGLLIRHSTLIEDEVASSGLLVPSAVIALVSSVLRKGEHDITQLYALRTIENICSQGGDWATRFNSQDVINNLCYIFKAVGKQESNLCYIFKAVGKQESTRLAAGSCLVRLVRFNPPTIQSVLEKLSFKDTASAIVKDILHTKTVSQCFEFLLGDLSSTNVSNVKLCLALASAPELESKILSQLQVVRKIGNLLEFVNAKEIKGSVYSNEPALLSDNNNSFHPQHSVKDISDIGSNIRVFLELSGSHETQVSDLASECVVLLVEAAPREATMELLVNLHKISGVLESQGGEISGILLLRMLYALGYSCRHYLSQAMILSISIPEITRIEALFLI